MPIPKYDLHAALRTACEGMLAYIREQLATDGQLPDPERENSPVEALAEALDSDAVDDLLRSGRDAAEWLTRNATPEERFDWGVACPHPEIDRFEFAERCLAEEGDPQE